MSPIIDSIKKEVQNKVTPKLNELMNSISKLFPSEAEVISEIISKEKYNNYYIIEHEYIDYMPFESDSYKIYNLNNELLYTIKGHLFFGKHFLYVYQDKKIIGTIKKRFITIPDILEGDSKLRICTIKNDNGEKYQMRTHVNNQKLHYKIKRKSWTMHSNNDEDIFSFSYKKTKIAHLYKYGHKKSLLGFNDLDMELDLIMMAVAFRNLIRI